MPSVRKRQRRGPHGCVLAATILILIAGAGGIALHLYDRHWERKFEARVAACRAAGQPVTWHEVLERREPVPEEENSALVLLDAYREFELAEQRDSDDLVEGLRGLGPLGVRHSQPIEDMTADYLAARAAGLKLVHEAAKMERGAYPLGPVDMAFELLMPHLGPARGAARACAAEAERLASTGRMDEALDGADAAFGVSASLRGEPILISVLVRIAIDAIACNALERTLALGEASPERLAALRKGLAEEEASLWLRDAMLSERSCGHYLFMGSSGEDLGMLGGGDRGHVFALYRAVPGWRWQDALLWYDTFDRYLEVAELPPRERVVASRRLADEMEHQLGDLRLSRLVSSMLLPPMARAFEEQTRAEVRLSVAQVALAVEQWRMQHGDWPEALGQLVPDLLPAVPGDLLSDGPLIYRRTEDGVVIYSVGSDGKDDRGISRDEANRRAGRESRLMEGFDISFRLLDPALRGARQMTFVQEVLESQIERIELRDMGFGRAKLRELGFTEDDLRRYGYLAPEEPPQAPPSQ